MRSLAAVIWSCIKAAIFVAIISVLLTIVVWFFGHIIAGAPINFKLWVRYSFFALYALDTMSYAWKLWQYRSIARRLDTSFTDVWEGFRIYGIHRSDTGDIETFRKAVVINQASAVLSRTDPWARR